MKNLLDIFITFVGFLTVLYLVPYVVRRGWLEGENAVTPRRKVCDTCFRSLDHIKRAMKELSK